MTAFSLAVRTFLRIALPYFRSEERWRARGLLLGGIAAELSVVYLAVLVNQWHGRFFNAMGYVWSAYCVYKMVMSCVNIVFKRVGMLDPITNTVQLTLRYSLGLRIDLSMWAQQASFVMVGAKEKKDQVWVASKEFVCAAVSDGCPTKFYAGFTVENCEVRVFVRLVPLHCLYGWT